MSTADRTDAQLGAEALRGDRDAFTELFGRHEAGIFNVAYRMTGSREDARDITQEAFLRVFARLDDLHGRDVNLAAYLHRTSRNLVYDRTEGRRREAPSAEIEAVAGPDTGMAADPQLSALVGAQGDDVRAASARLPERHRLALALRELEGMGYGDIGRVLDITPGAVAQLLARARMGLRRELRLGQVAVEEMEPGCRSRLGDIAALIDGELDPDRTHVLTQHLELCASCREARRAFEDAGRRYRAWLPLPVLLGLGAETARAAEGRGLVRFAGGGRRGGGWRRGDVVARGSRARLAGVAGAGALAVAVLVAVPIVVATRSGSTPPAPVPLPVAAVGTTTGSAPATPPPTTSASPRPRPAGTSGGTTTAAPPGGPAPPAASGSPGATPEVAAAPLPAATTGSAPATPPPVTTTTPRRPRPRPAAVPTVGAAGDPAPPPAAPPPTPPAADPPAADPPVVPDAPPGTTTSRDPVEPPPATTTTTREAPPDIPFPTTFTIPRPPP